MAKRLFPNSVDHSLSSSPCWRSSSNCSRARARHRRWPTSSSAGLARAVRSPSAVQANASCAQSCLARLRIAASSIVGISSRSSVCRPAQILGHVNHGRLRFAQVRQPARSALSGRTILIDADINTPPWDCGLPFARHHHARSKVLPTLFALRRNTANAASLLPSRHRP
jgi:hypothetical protein